MNFVSDHGIALLAAWYGFSSIVSGMPAPKPTSSQAYLWAYHSLHVLAGNVGQLLAKVKQ
jgi:hypothetical protein